MKTLNAFALLVLLVSLPLLLGGCGEKQSIAETKLLKEKQQEVKPEEPVAETKPTEAVSVDPNLKYETEGDAVTITGCDKKASGALIIPATIDGNPVTSIGNYAFFGCSSLTSITIGDGVTSIGNSAFYYCTILTSITIPDSVTSIGEKAFSGCKGLSAVTFLGDAPKVAETAFEEASPTIYRKPEAKGWGETFADRPVKLISEKT